MLTLSVNRAKDLKVFRDEKRTEMLVLSQPVQYLVDSEAVTSSLSKNEATQKVVKCMTLYVKSRRTKSIVSCSL